MFGRIAVAAALCSAACSDSSCNTNVVDVSEICAPISIAPNFGVVVDVRELCGAGCSGVPSCTSFLRNAQVILETEQDFCTDAVTSDCANDPCQQRVIHCQLPSLTVGEYVVFAPGGVSRVLRVEPDGASSCRFPPDGGV